MNKLFCDRCGKEIITPRKPMLISVAHYVTSKMHDFFYEEGFLDETWHYFCTECADSYLEWFKSGRKDNKQ